MLQFHSIITSTAKKRYTDFYWQNKGILTIISTGKTEDTDFCLNNRRFSHHRQTKVWLLLSLHYATGKTKANEYSSQNQRNFKPPAKHLRLIIKRKCTVNREIPVKLGTGDQCTHNGARVSIISRYIRDTSMQKNAPLLPVYYRQKPVAWA